MTVGRIENSKDCCQEIADNRIPIILTSGRSFVPSL